MSSSCFFTCSRWGSSSTAMTNWSSTPSSRSAGTDNTHARCLLECDQSHPLQSFCRQRRHLDTAWPHTAMQTFTLTVLQAVNGQLQLDSQACVHGSPS
jgi:hypothetical protein